MERQSWDESFFEAAELFSRRSTCLRRQYGCVLVRDKTIISTGFNGAPRGCWHCTDFKCAREGKPTGTFHELCRGAHAEQNAIANAARIGVSTIGSELYIKDMPCTICTKILINAGVAVIHYRKTDYPGWKLSKALFDEAKVELVKG